MLNDFNTIQGVRVDIVISVYLVLPDGVDVMELRLGRRGRCRCCHDVWSGQLPLATCVSAIIRSRVSGSTLTGGQNLYPSQLNYIVTSHIYFSHLPLTSAPHYHLS